MTYFWLFIGLQLADCTTTLVGLSMGAAEANPMLGWFFAASGSYVVGLLIGKALAILAALGMWMRGHRKVYRDLTVFFAAVVLWNCGTLIRLA